MRLAHRSHGASLRAIRAATPARCPDGRPSSRLRTSPPRGASPGDRRARAVLRNQHAGIHRGGNATRPRVRITARAERRGAANETTVKGTSGHGTHFFAEVWTSARSSPGARFFTQVLHLRDRERRGREVSAVFANESSPAAPVTIGGSPARPGRVRRRGHAGGRRSWPGARASSHPEHRLSGGEPTPSRRRVGDDAPTEPARVRAEPAGMHRRAVVLTVSSPCKMHPEQGDLADLARSTASPRTSSRSSSRETTDAGG